MRQDFVIAQELLHLRIPTHGRLLKALMSAHLPGWQKLERDLVSSYLATTGAAPPLKVPLVARLAKYSYSKRSSHASHGVP